MRPKNPSTGYRTPKGLGGILGRELAEFRRIIDEGSDNMQETLDNGMKQAFTGLSDAVCDAADESNRRA